MSSVRDFLKMSDKLKSYTTEYLSSEMLSENFIDLSVEEQKAILNHYFVDGRAATLSKIPVLYDQIISYMADCAEVPVSHVKIIGSFKLGFCTGSDYGHPFTANSDIDIAIFDENLFNRLVQEKDDWQMKYKKGECLPRNPNERIYWDDNIRIMESKIKQGFIDTYRLPNRYTCPMVCQLHNAAYLIECKLKEYHKIMIRKRGVSIRVYKNHTYFIDTLLYNTITILNKKVNQSD